MKQCSKERGCNGKTNLGSNFAHAVHYAERLTLKHGKSFGIYICPHCGGHHLTTKLHKKDQYMELMYITTLDSGF